MTQLYDCRDAYSNTLIDLAHRDQHIVVVANDSIGSSKLQAFAKAFPQRLVNVGIAEQNMVGIAAGLANGGKIPFVSGASPFLTARALEQIKVDLAYTQANVKLCGMSSGLAYGELGPTHHSIEDLAWTRSIANMTVIVPADPLETEQAMRAAACFVGPIFLRISRIPVPVVHNSLYQFQIGRAVQLREGRDVTLIATGVMVSRALEAATLLAQRGIQARVINMSTIRPIDREAIIDAACSTGAIVTVEEHTIYGGLGSAVAEVASTTCSVPMRMLGIPGVFAPTGSANYLLEHFGLTARSICDTAAELVEERTLNEARHNGR